MKIYIVGGAVRDELLNRTPKDIDYAVVGCTHEDMINNGFECVGKDFPVYLKNGEEYALARQERKVGGGHGGFTFNTDPTVTIEDDLMRRDLTVNAIARDLDTGEMVDPYNGLSDIENRVLRHVSSAFSEDPLRVLRVARFMARYHHLGFTVADETKALMSEVVRSGELTLLTVERVWKEIDGALGEKSPHIFIKTLREVGALEVVLPEIDALYGVPLPPEHHPEVDCGIHMLMALKQAAKLTECKLTRFVTMVHDLGKAVTPAGVLPSHRGHEDAGAEIVADLMQRLKAPKEWTRLAVITAKYHTHVHRAFEMQPKSIVKLFCNVDAFRRPHGLDILCTAAEADSRGRQGFEDRDYPQADHLRELLKLTKNADLSNVVYTRPDVKEQIAHARVVAIRGVVEAKRTR
jgi:tRNA nucleotidyltransferase (CCA-adding enzyme)